MTPHQLTLFNLIATYALYTICFLSVAACIGWLIWIANHKGRVE